MRHEWANFLAIVTTLVLGAAAWALTRDATPYYALDLLGALLVWTLLVAVVAAFVGTLAKALR